MNELKYEGSYNTWAEAYEIIIKSQRIESVQKKYFNNYMKKVHSQMNQPQDSSKYSYALES
jgi:hypothetical protein